jgi:predicted PurR-regulated permease PerM
MTLSAVVVFLTSWAGLALLKVPLALLCALVCGLLTFVPTIGPTAATLLPMAVALLLGSPAQMVQVLMLRLVLQSLEAFVLTPVLLNRTVNLLPTVALMAQLSLGALLGLPGLLLALPLVVAATPSFYRPRVRVLLGECRQALGGWLAGMTLSAVVVFLTSWAGLALLKVPLALLCALVCGLLTFVPTIGPTAATLLPMAVALLLGSPALMVQVLMLRLVLQNLEAFVLTPVLLNRTVNLLPTVALMAQLSLGALLGLPGLLLALPLVVVIQVLGEEVLVRDIMDRWDGR